MHSYRVVCLKCKQSDEILIDDSHHYILDFRKKIQTNFLSGRWRKDQAWGWECRCGNDSRLAKEEKGDIKMLVQGNPLSVKKLVDSLKISDTAKFTMEIV